MNATRLVRALTIAIFTAQLSVSAIAAPGARPAKPVVKVPAETSESKLLWDAWYTITVSETLHYGYYNERVELKRGRLHFQNHMWKKEGYVNEEQLGAFAENDDDITPLFYNFHSTYRSSETNIDGTVIEGKTLNVRIKKGGAEMPVIKHSLPPKAIFSVFFPLWLKSRVYGPNAVKTAPFLSILEDNLEAGFLPLNGRMKVEKPDSIAQSTGTTKVSVDYRNMKSTWWIDEKGSAARIEMPAQKAVIVRVSKEKAEAFLAK